MHRGRRADVINRLQLIDRQLIEITTQVAQPLPRYVLDKLRRDRRAVRTEGIPPRSTHHQRPQRYAPDGLRLSSKCGGAVARYYCYIA
jgi:hypothetical protein